MAFLAAIPAAIGIGGAAAGAATTGISFGQILSGFGTALSAFGAIQSGIAGANAASYQAQVAEFNAKIATDNARMARERSQEQQMEQDTLTLGQLGEQEAIQSATGLSGRSQMLTRKAAIQLGRQDALRVIKSGEMDAWNFENQASAARAESSAYSARASSSMLSGFLNAGSSLISGASALANPNKYNPYQRKAV